MLTVGDGFAHFGSGRSETDYESKGHVLFTNLEFYPGDKFNMYFKCNYTMAEGSFDTREMELPDEVVAHGDYDYSIMEEYSDLDQSFYEIGVGGSYRVHSNLSVFADIVYVDFSDDEIFVYGDRSGTFYNAMLGATLHL